MSELGPDGQLLFDVKLPADADTYRAYRFAWTGQPVDRPALAITPDGVARAGTARRRSRPGRCSRGRVLEALESVTVGHRTGFETALRVKLDTGYVAVRALSGDTVIGTSAIRKL